MAGSTAPLTAHTSPARTVEQACADLNLRMTRPRRIIVDLLDSAQDHPDVVELHRRASQVDPRISLSTVYRTVKMLEERGAVARHQFGDGRARYETNAAVHHDHLINVEDGGVIEFRSEEIERLQEEIARQHGFSIVSHRLEIYVVPMRRSRSRRAPKG
jgi:Fur family transcriptional regulator, ferric uptake regulator